MALNITTAVIGSGCNAATASPSLAQWDKGQILQISGVELPETYKVEFSNGDTLEAIPAIGTAEGVEIPDKLLYSSSPIRVYIVLSEAEGERNTEYWVTIYVKPREIPEDVEPTPAQQDVIDDLIAQLNTGVGKAEAAADAAEAASQAVQDLGVEAETLAAGAPAAVEKIVDAETGAVTLRFGLPRGADGASPVVTVTTITGGHRVTVTDAAGAHTFDVMDGEDGRSVTGVTMGADYTLTFTFSDGTTWTTPTSIRGETGATPRFTIGTVSTLDPDQSATASITGTPEDPVLNLGIPKGQAGASDAGGVTYDPTESYQSGTAGAALNDLSRQLSDLTDVVSTTQIINSASGAIASFDDGADNQPIRKLVAQIEPVQDLNGYDNPWPAGGGKNIADPSKMYLFSNNTYIGTNNYSTQGAFDVESNTQYTISAISAGGDGRIIFWDENGEEITPRAQTATFTTPANCAKISFYRQLGSAVTDISAAKLMIAKGTDTVYSPYSNICPISGWTGAKANVTGINVWDEEWELGVFNNSTGQKIPNSVNSRSKNYISVKPGKSYRCVIAEGIRIFWYGQDKSFISTSIVPMNNNVITSPENAYFLMFQFSGTSYSNNISINYPATDTEYHPYTGNQISVNWEDEAGTVYGGTLDVISGVLTVTNKKVAFNDLTWVKESSYFFTNTGDGYLADSTQEKIRAISSIYRSESQAIGGGVSSLNIIYPMAAIPSRILARPSGYADLDVASWLANVGTETIVYELATPVTYQLTPQELDTLLGTNNIWSDTGDTEVTYPCDTRLYIDNKIAEAIAALNA